MYCITLKNCASNMIATVYLTLHSNYWLCDHCGSGRGLGGRWTGVVGGRRWTSIVGRRRWTSEVGRRWTSVVGRGGLCQRKGRRD